MSEVTRILSAIEQGDSAASEQLLPLVYQELRSLAAAKMANEKPGQTLQATALVHDAYLRLVDVEKAQHWDSRGHFFSAAAEAMRRILVERARRRKAAKHGGGMRQVDLPDMPSQDRHDRSQDHLLALDNALSKLQEYDQVKAELVKLRYFAGLTIPRAANLGLHFHAARRRISITGSNGARHQETGIMENTYEQPTDKSPSQELRLDISQ